MNKASIPFTKGEFLQAALDPDSLTLFYKTLIKSLPEIAIVGKSNVGKSSLINHLLKNSTLAKTSSKPGKTQTINFFSVDHQLLLVDLPGYGYAKADKKSQEIWSGFVDRYISSSSRLKSILVLIDSRHPLGENDAVFIQWAKLRQIPLIFIYTKSDKLNKEELKNQIHSLNHSIQQLLGEEKILSLTYSIKNSDSRVYLVKLINQVLRPS